MMLPCSSASREGETFEAGEAPPPPPPPPPVRTLSERALKNIITQDLLPFQVGSDPLF